MGDIKYREPNKVLWRGVRPAHNGDQVIKSMLSAAANVTVYTVPAGKVFYLSSLIVCADCTAAGLTSTVLIRNDLAGTVANLFHWVTRLADHITMSQSFNPPIEMGAGYDIRINRNSASVPTNVCVHGWAEDA